MTVTLASIIALGLAAPPLLVLLCRKREPRWCGVVRYATAVIVVWLSVMEWTAYEVSLRVRAGIAVGDVESAAADNGSNVLALLAGWVPGVVYVAALGALRWLWLRFSATMSIRTKRLAVGGISGTLALCTASLLLPALARRTNCGGNSAALAACRAVQIGLQLAGAEHGGRPVSITELTTSEREYFGQVPGLRWLGGATVLVTVAPTAIGDSGGKAVVAVCDRAYDNVPQRRFGRALFTHAVAYADGSAGLISVEDFRRLDMSRFVNVRTLANGPAGPAEPVDVPVDGGAPQVGARPP